MMTVREISGTMFKSTYYYVILTIINVKLRVSFLILNEFNVEDLIYFVDSKVEFLHFGF